MTFMLDTDICIYLMSGRYPSLDRRMAAEHGPLSVSVITYAELRFGADFSRRVQRNRDELEAMIEGLILLDFDAAAARHYGEIRAELERTGKLVGGNDLLIGAHARSLDATLVTNNRREFDRIPGLKIENWAA